MPSPGQKVTLDSADGERLDAIATLIRKVTEGPDDFVDREVRYLRDLSARVGEAVFPNDLAPEYLEQGAGESGSGEEGETCNRCGGRNAVWSASSPLWNAVMRGGSIDGEPKFNDMVCATCFMQLAEEQGIASVFRVTADRVNVELETVSPSSRVWDESRLLWIDPPGAPTQPLQGSEVDRDEEIERLTLERDMARGQSGLKPFTGDDGEQYSPATPREQEYLAASVVNQRKAKDLQAQLQRVEEENRGLRSQIQAREEERCDALDRAAQAEALPQKAAKEFEAWAAEEESRIPGAESRSEREGHRLAALTAKRCAEHLRSQSSSEAAEGRCGGSGRLDTEYRLLACPGCPDCKQEDPAGRRERAVDELLEIAKLADDEVMKAELEGLASRAVEAACAAVSQYELRGTAEGMRKAIVAAEPHLQRMYLERFREAVETPIHELALTIGRAQVHLNADAPALAKRELNGAAEALGWLQAALAKAQDLMDESK